MMVLVVKASGATSDSSLAADLGCWSQLIMLPKHNVWFSCVRVVRLLMDEILHDLGAPNYCN